MYVTKQVGPPEPFVLPFSAAAHLTACDCLTHTFLFNSVKEDKHSAEDTSLFLPLESLRFCRDEEEHGNDLEPNGSLGKIKS